MYALSRIALVAPRFAIAAAAAAPYGGPVVVLVGVDGFLTGLTVPFSRPPAKRVADRAGPVRGGHPGSEFAFSRFEPSRF